MKTRVLLIVLLLPLLLVACNRRGETSVERNPEGGIDITTALSEADVNAIVTEALANMENPLLRDPQVDLQNGQIVVNGEHDRRDGNGRVSGNVILTVSVVSGAILVEATQVNIEGFDMSDERLAMFNQQLQAGFNRRADPDNRLINVQSVSISDDALTIVINARRAN